MLQSRKKYICMTVQKDKNVSALKNLKAFSIQQGFYVTLTLTTFSALLFLDNRTLKYKQITSQSEQSNHSNNQ